MLQGLRLLGEVFIFRPKRASEFLGWFLQLMLQGSRLLSGGFQFISRPKTASEFSFVLFQSMPHGERCFQFISRPETASEFVRGFCG